MRGFSLIVCLLLVTPMLCAAQARPAASISLLTEESATLWRGGQSAPGRGEENAFALCWKTATSPELALDAIPHNWSAYNLLSLRIYSPHKSSVVVTVIIASDDRATEGSDYFTASIPMDFSGWRLMSLPFDEFSQVRQPLGWHKIDRFRLHARWNPRDPTDPEEAILVSEVRLSRIATAGPRMSLQEFFDDLDLDRPSLENVRSAVKLGDIDAAVHAFAAYFRERRSPRWFFDWRQPPAHPLKPNTAYADQILMHKFMMTKFPFKTYDFGPRIDWSSNAMSEGESKTIEWNSQLNRHYYLRALADAYQATGDETYAREAVAQITAWIEDCPVLLMQSGNSPYHYAWETLNTAVRSGDQWFEILFRILPSRAVTDEFLALMARSLAEHARHLMKNPTSGNWLTMESTAIFIVGTMLPEFKEAANWRHTGIQRLLAQLTEEIYPDGMEVEIAPGYNYWVLQNLTRVLEIARRNDVLDDLPRDYLARLERMFDYYLLVADPRGKIPPVNDSGAVDLHRALKQAVGYYPQREDFLFRATDGREGKPPAETSHACTYSGHYVMRSGWDPDARYLFFEAGPYGTGHQHEDMLTICLTAYGREHVVDAGVYMYDASRWRRYVRSTRGHNTIRVDGQDQNRRSRRDTWILPLPFKPLANPWMTTSSYDYATAAYDCGYGPDNAIAVKHTRRILFVKPDYWILVDTLTPKDDGEHRYEQLFHLNAGDIDVDAATCRVSTRNAGDANLALIPLSDQGLQVSVVKGREEEEVQGWAAGPWRPVPTAVYTKSGRGPIRFLTLLYPTAAGQSPPVEAVERIPMEGEDTVAMRIRFGDGRTHLCLQSDNPGTMRTFEGYRTDSEMALVETDANGSMGRRLLVNGKVLEKQGVP